MALKRLTINGYGQVELNQVAFRRDGRIEAQCFLDLNSFNKDVPAENGMLLAVDRANRTIKMPSGAANELIALNYSSEHMYDNTANGLKDFSIVPNEQKNYFLPRLGYIAKGDKFTTNCIAYDTTEFATEDLVKTAIGKCKETALYGKPCANGAIQLTATAPTTGVALQVVAQTTMPDGQFAVMVQAIKE